MLVLSRKIDERIRIGDEIVLTLVAVKGQRAKIGIEAPSDVAIVREELSEGSQAQGTSEDSDRVAA